MQLIPFIGLLTGCALRTVLPYVISALEAVRDAGRWDVWPAFDASYLASFALAVVAYGVALLTIPGAWAFTLNLDLVSAVGLAYTAQSLGREAIKLTRHG